MLDIDIGGACIQRPNSTGDNLTCIEKNNPANASGIITNVCLWVAQLSTPEKPWYLGIFYLVSGTTYHCRSAHGPFYPVRGQNNIEVNMSVETGDFIGVYLPGGVGTAAYIAITRDVGLNGQFVEGNHCIVGDETEYHTGPKETYSLYGTGIGTGTPCPPPSCVFAIK